MLSAESQLTFGGSALRSTAFLERRLRVHMVKRDRLVFDTSFAPPAKTTTFPDEVVVKAIGVGQPAFLRCWARAQRTDPVLISTKVHLHLEIDASGRVASVRSDSDSPKLASCLAVVARQLPFPAPGTPAVVDMPLIFR